MSVHTHSDTLVMEDTHLALARLWFERHPVIRLTLLYSTVVTMDKSYSPMRGNVHMMQSNPRG